MPWQKVETVTLSVAGKSLVLPTFTAKKFLVLLNHSPIGTLVAGRNARLEFNADAGINYTWRHSANGGTDTTAVGQTYAKIDTAGGDNDGFNVGYCIDITSEEKLGIHFIINANAAGSANAPNRADVVYKWTGAVQIVESEINSTTDDYTAGANYTILGTD